MSGGVLSVRCVERGHGWSPWVVASHPCLNGDMPQSLTTNIDDVALVFEGGGMRAAHTSAVVQELIANELWFDWVGGISAGATNTINYASRDAARAATSFIDMSEDPNFGSWRTWVRGKGVFNAEYIYEQTGEPGQAFPLDLETFTANPATVRIGAFNANTGESRYWGKDEMTTVREIGQRARASSTMPGLMPFVTIDGETWCDGALGPSGGIALDAAMADGYERFFVVLTRQSGYRKAAPRLPRAYGALFRRYPKVAAALLQRHENYNRTLEQLASLEERGRAYVYRPERMTISNQERRIDRLRAAHADGVTQSRRDLPGWKRFLGR